MSGASRRAPCRAGRIRATQDHAAPRTLDRAAARDRRGDAAPAPRRRRPWLAGQSRKGTAIHRAAGGSTIRSSRSQRGLRMMAHMRNWGARSMRGQDAARSREPARGGWSAPWLAAVALLALLAPAARAGLPYIWDEDT